MEFTQDVPYPSAPCLPYDLGWQRLSIRRKLCAETFELYRNPDHVLSILVLENGPELDPADNLLDKLEALGHDVIAVHSEQEGETTLRQMIARLEFVDVVLMRCPGFGLCKFCRTRLPGRLQPTFVMYADDAPTERDWSDLGLVGMCLQYDVQHLLRPGSAPLMLVQVLGECAPKMPVSQHKKLRRRRSSLVSNVSTTASQDSGFEGDDDMQSSGDCGQYLDY